MTYFFTWCPCSFLSRKRVVVYDSVSISVDSIKSPRKIDIHYHLSLICLIQLVKQRSIPNFTSSMLTIWFALLLVTNGKQHFEHAMGLLNGVLYLKGSLMLQQPFNALSMTFSPTCLMSQLLFSLMTYLSIWMTRNHIRQTFRKSFTDGLFCNPFKCEFHTDIIEYLSYILLLNGLRMASDKVDTITQWPTPHKVKDIQSFLGFCNFYRFNYSEITIPLTRLTRKNALWQ